MRHVVRAILLASIALTFGCSSPVESFCNKRDECGKMSENETVEECIAEGNKMLAEYREKGCDELADAYEAFFDCMASQSCDDLKDSDKAKAKCAEAGEAVAKAEREKPRQCEPPQE